MCMMMQKGMLRFCCQLIFLKLPRNILLSCPRDNIPDPPFYLVTTQNGPFLFMEFLK